jgi:hypothetical protein
VADSIGGFTGGRQNKAWPKRKKKRTDLDLQVALLTNALKPRLRS